MSLTSVRPSRPLIWHPCIDDLRAAISPNEAVYLVGGAVRDAYLHRPLHDVDLATPDDGRPLARRLANTFNGAYYPLDNERGVGRALIPWTNEQIIIDVAQFRGADLLTDLRERDFTLNAMAVKLTSDPSDQLQAVIDPMGGLADLAAKRLRACTTHSISSDPVRILRALRASLQFGLIIDPSTRNDLQNYASTLPQVSAERIRDEFFAILGGPRPAAALAVLNQLGILAYIIPETTAMQRMTQGPPHQLDVWQHTLSTISHLDTLLQVIEPQRSSDATANIQTGTVAFAISHIRAQLQDHLAHQWPNERPHRALLMLAALMHDAGKPATRTVELSMSEKTGEPEEHIRFLQHEQTGADLIAARANALRLSQDELKRLQAIVKHHMRPHWLASESPLSSRAIYRFWRDTGETGVDICLLALADYLGTYGVTLDSQAWIAYVNTIQTLLSRYFLQHDSAITPPPLLTGQDVLDVFDLKPGPQIGEILKTLRESQAIGEINTKEEALDWVQRFLVDQQ